jgi:hypothetical protein
MWQLLEAQINIFGGHGTMDMETYNKELMLI